jgi:hypothetical protein
MRLRGLHEFVEAAAGDRVPLASMTTAVSLGLLPGYLSGQAAASQPPTRAAEVPRNGPISA